MPYDRNIVINNAYFLNSSCDMGRTMQQVMIVYRFGARPIIALAILANLLEFGIAKSHFN